VYLHLFSIALYLENGKKSLKIAKVYMFFCVKLEDELYF